MTDPFVTKQLNTGSFRCKFCSQVVRELSDEQKVQLYNALFVTKVNGKSVYTMTIVNVLKDWNVHASESSIRRHRFPLETSECKQRVSNVWGAKNDE